MHSLKKFLLTSLAALSLTALIGVGQITPSGITGSAVASAAIIFHCPLGCRAILECDGTGCNFYCDCP
jgi:hypothetical protein